MPKPTRGGTIVNTKSVKIDAATLRKKLPRLGSAAETVAAALSDAATAASSERAPLYLDAWAKGEKVPALAARKSPPTLRGRVTGIGDGTGRAGMTVRVFAKGLTSDESLGETKTGRRGDYALVYKREGTRVLDLVVRVFGAGTAPLAQSPILYNARWTEIVDLTVDSTEGLLSEYQALAEKAGPLLNGGSAANLTEKEIDYLSGKTNEPELHLAYYVLAHRHARNTGVRPETFYGLFRLGFPTALPALLAQPPQQLKEALALCAQRAICPAGLEPDADRLHDQAADRILSAPKGSPRALLAVAGLNVDEQKAFVSAYVRRPGSTEEFWNSLTGTPLAGKIDDLKNVVQLGHLTGDNAPLVQTLRARGFRAARDLASLDQTALQSLLESSDDLLSGVPSVKEGELKSEKSARVAEEILGTLKEAFPTAVFSSRLAKSASTPAAKGAARLLANAPDLELRDDDIDGFLVREGERVFAGVEDRTGAVDHLKKYQRLMRVAPQAEHMERLLSEGFGSAREMAGLSERSFVEKFGAVFGEAHAKTYHQKARQTSSDLALMATGVLQAVNDVPLAAVGLPSAQLKTMPTLAGLFGSFGLCECKDCRSVYSPAAYLVDLLEFINPKAGPKPIQFLRLRRPDLEHIPLTCENTNTVLPAVDLANEVFEYFTANGAMAPGAARDTAGSTSEELGVTPQYTLKTAYQVLQTAAATPILPFHRPLESARLSLAHMGTSRHELMGAFQKNGAPSSLETELEFLSMSRAERAILTGMDPRPLREFFGYGSDQAPLIDEGGSLGHEFWEDNIRRVPEFLRRTGTAFQDLSWVIGSRLLNIDEPRMFLKETGGVPTGDLTKTEIVNLSPVRLEKIHRFLRLARKTGWTLTELEEAMGILQSAEINDALLGKIAAAKRLESELKLPPMVLFSLWGNLSTRGKPSLYSQLFENKAVRNPVDPDFALTDANPFPFSGKTLGEKTPLLLAALRLKDADLSRIRGAAGLAADDAPLTLGALSTLHRYTALARAMKLAIKDFLALVDLLGLDPFQSGAPEPTAVFVQRAKTVLSSGFTLPQLTSLFRSEGASPAETNGAIAAIRDGLAKIAAETAVGPDPAGERMRARLASVLPPESLADGLALIDGTGGLSDPAGFIEAHFALWTDVQEAKTILLDPAPADPEERKDKNRTYVLARLLAHARRVMSREFVLQYLGTACGMELPALDALLTAGLKSSLDGTQFSLTDFLALSDPSNSTAAAERSFRRLRKAAAVIERFGLTDREIDFMARHPKKAGGFDLNTLPVDPGPVDPSVFSAWEQTLQLFQFRSRWPREKGDMVDFLSAETRGEVLDALLRASEWDADQTIQLADAEGFDLSLADLQSVGGLARLEKALSVAQRTGLPPATLFAEASTEPSFERADLLLNAVKAKYDAAQWPAAAKPIGDALREKCHAALVSHMLTLDAVAKKKIFTAEGLFAYFLIDAEMTAVPKTSRIKQAISSVQLFIQRCLMNLETGVPPSAIDADQWEWMKNYRVWEANRKVFLYPENWIEPELRDDKTPLFRDLESQLMQNDLSAETAEAAFLSYLEKLDGVANLEVRGFYTEEEPGQPAVTHVVGRTPDAPHVHYYRRREEGRGWTPWEKIDMDVEGDHILPRVHNNRLYLFWVTFEEKPDKEKMLEGPFLQSQEHWQWVQDHQEWREEHDAWQAIKDARDAWESMLDAIRKAVDPFLNDEQMEEFVNSFSDNAPPEPGDEPREPTEPQRGVDPVMTRWEIKLHWTENKNGKWSPKRSAQETVQSHFVWRTLEDWQEEQGVTDLSDVGTKDTVAAVFLPAPEDHYFRTSLSNGRLRVTVYRRFAKSFPVLNAGEVTARAHQAIGAFQFHEGAKVRATQLFGPLDYAALKKPAKTTNRAQQLADTGGQSFTFIQSDGSPHPVFETLPASAGKYALTVEHQFNEFKMGSPFHPFFFQNKLGSYMAYEKWDLPADAPGRRGGKRAPAFSFDTEEEFVSPYRTQSLSWPSEKRAMFTGKSRSLAALRTSGEGSLAGNAPLRFEGTTGEESIGLAVSDVFETGLPAFVGKRRIPGTLSFLKPFLKFDAFFHPQTGAFMSLLYQKGVPGLLARATQSLDNDAGPLGNLFKARYRPTSLVHRSSPREQVDFGAGAYAMYNWELFFHVPFLIALALGKNQRFEEAAAWFHFIFNPMTVSNETAPGRYWNTLPFFKNTNPEEDQPFNLFQVLSSTDPAQADRRAEVEEQIQRWREDPFNPHLIARLRITAYQKNVVMKYIDHLIQRGDQLFQMDTLESINEATLVFVLAHDLMGRRPVDTPSPVAIDPKSYHQLKGEGLDAFSNALVSFENALPYSPPAFQALSVYSQKSPLGKAGKAQFAPVKIKRAAAAIVSSAPETFYFCLPKNDRLLKMWDILEDRLFKIRHGLNIDGIARELPLFEPPIDPALLVKAAAAGVSLSSVLSDATGPFPRHRFGVMVQKALELCAEVKSLGAALLSALEKKDGERLAQLRAGHETALLKAVRDVKRRQVEEADTTLESLRKSKVLAETRRDYYRDIDRISGYEQENMDSLDSAHVFSQIAQGVAAGASGAHITPNFEIGTNGWAATPKVTAMFGGDNLGNALEAISKNIAMISAQFSHEATMASIRGGYDRRWKEWKFQEKLSQREMDQIDKQLLGAEIRRAIAEKELEAHDQQIENAASVESHWREKYTNADLYGWMQGEIARVYFQAYKLAYDLAKRAEQAFRFEVGVADSRYIQFGYWDDLRRGLMAGEKLFLDLKRLETAHLEQNRREFEIVKQVSMAQLDPSALIRLKETGVCEMELPEALFDMDYPGHYMRRIKSVALTLPCVAGPHTGVHCTLTLLSAKTRRDPTAQGDYEESVDAEDPRFDSRFGGPASVATSHGRNDAGLFEVNFRDERYLPFEGAGAVSRWRLALPKETNAFDVGTLSDVILHVHYTARDGGDLLRRKAMEAVALASPREGLTRFFSARHEFPDGWHRFLHETDPAGSHSLSLDLTAQRFPFPFRGKTIDLQACDVVLKLKAGAAYENGANLSVDVRREGGSVFLGKELIAGALFHLPTARLFGDQAEEPLGQWTLAIPSALLPALHSSLKKQVIVNNQPQWRLNPDAIDDLWILARYRVTS